MHNISTLPAGKIIGIETAIFTIMNQEKYDPKAIPSAWQEFFGKYQQSDLPKESTFYGVTIPNGTMDIPMKYMAGLLVKEESSIPAGMTSLDFPGGNYWLGLHKGPITELANTYKHIYIKEFAETGLEMRPAPHIEIYNSQLNPMDDDYELSIGIPIL